MILVYDKTFEGFLTLTYDVYYKKLKVSKILKEYPNILEIEEIKKIKTNENKATKVLEALKNKFPKESLELILNIFMCDSKEFELNLLKFIVLGFKNKDELFNINKQEVFYLQTIEKELFRQVHKMYGFVRFQELDDGTLYARIETKYNLVYFLGRHFLKRLNNQKYIIHDINRKLAFIKNDDFTGIQNVTSFKEPNLSKDEEKFEKLWQTFFKSVTIQERKNLKCQQNLVPLIYRTYMSEFMKS